MLLVLAAIPAGYFSATTIHELGHALACLLLRLRIERFAVWPFSLGREGNSWKLAVWPKSWSAGTGGFVRFRPGTSQRSKVRWAAVLLAGPLASALSAYICFYIYELFPDSPALSTFINTLGFTALLQFVRNILPLKPRKTSRTDGWRLWELIRTWHELTESQALLLLAEQLKLRKPRDWDKSLLDRALQSPRLAIRYKNWLNYRRCADTGQLAEARAALDQVRAHSSDDHNCLLLWESVWFEACHARDLAAAQRHLAEAQNCPRTPANALLRCKALEAIAALEGPTGTVQAALFEVRESLKDLKESSALLTSALTEVLSRAPQP